MIKFSNVSKRYSDGTHAVNDLDLEIEDGEIFVLIGPSGCGKTTTLKMMNRLIDVTDGTIFVDGKEISNYDIHELRWEIGYVLQQIALFPHMTIEENIAVVPEMKKWGREKTRSRVDELLKMVGLDPVVYRTRKPDELSGGQQQRIGVARALAADPRLILMDEPFSALDPISREKLQDDILDLQRTIKKTIVFVTHDMQEALKLGDRICIMKEGKIVQVGTAQEIIESPANEFVKEFVGIEGRLDERVDLEPLVESSVGHDTSDSPVSAVSSLKLVLEALSRKDELPVEKDGQIIGMINRQKIVQHLAERMQERGQGL
ncbi:ABC transporter ATP-binding protein [Lederbergia citrea]|uniref:Quaternary amine transport ATP-binding protein n=1 Tax=Lederbergia citrea TaxID=2833581 RepID=A0A942UW61_9BACI|nr:ABC transporter ATP-binding protein [Lederbergia citrea]MBS4223959.1 ABC transporter ATP-binding protein [Lederbergia citrea]